MLHKKYKNRWFGLTVHWWMGGICGNYPHYTPIFFLSHFQLESSRIWNYILGYNLAEREYLRSFYQVRRSDHQPSLCDLMPRATYLREGIK